MRVLAKCCAAIALHLCALPLAAQEDEPTDSVDLQEQLALDTNALVVLPIEILTTDSRAPALAAEAYELILSELASVDGLYVIGRESILPYGSSTLPAVEIARELGVGTILESSIQSDTFSVSLDVTLIDARTGESRGSGHLLELSPNLHIPDPPFDLDTLMPDMASRIAEQVENMLFPKPRLDRQQRNDEAQAIFLDASLGDNERLEALREVWPLVGNAGPEYRDKRNEALSGAAAIAAAQLAIYSDDSGVRARVWSMMAGVDDPYLVQPLLHSLANDADEGVRRVAAETLKGFLDEPGVREALEYARDYDASERVRSEIRFSVLSTADQQEESRAMALDTSLSADERWSAIRRVLNDEQGQSSALDEPLTAALVDVAKSADNRLVRAHSWSMLSETADPNVVQPLLEALASDSDAGVRESAAKGLTEFPDQPGVREGFERALVNDSNEHVRDAAARGLVEFLDEPGVREALEEALVNDASPLVRKRVGESLGYVER
jgi:HEAT repeat protein/TolB-like protein